MFSATGKDKLTARLKDVKSDDTIVSGRSKRATVIVNSNHTSLLEMITIMNVW